MWTARTLASLDPNINTRGMQRKMEAETLARYGPGGTTYAQHHQENMEVFTTALREHPWPMAKRFVISALQNATRGSELHAHQLPQFKVLWNKIEPFVHKRAGAALLALTVLGALLLVSDVPITPEGVKTEESDARVTRDWADLHLQIGIDAMTQIDTLGEPIRHFQY